MSGTILVEACVDSIESALAAARNQARELYGDEVLRLLEAQSLTLPEVDLTKDEAWPRL